MQEDNKYLFNKRLKIPIYTAFLHVEQTLCSENSWIFISILHSPLNINTT